MKTFGIKFAFVLVFCSAMLFAFGQDLGAPVTILEDDFEGADLSAWANTLAVAESGLSTDQAVSGTQSVLFDADEEGHLIQSFAGVNAGANKVTATFWMYDPLGQGGAHAWASGRCGLTLASYSGGAWGDGDLDGMIFLGAYHEDTGHLQYRGRVVGGANWVTTTVDRSVGWHKFEIILHDGMVEMYIDDVLGYSEATNTDMDWNGARFGSPAGAVHTTDFYIDDFSITVEEEIQEEWEPVVYAKSVATPNGIADALRMAVDSTGRLYVTNNSGTIWYTDNPLDDEPTYEELVTGIAAANGIQGIAIDADDNVYFSGDNASDGFVGKYNAAGVEEWFNVTGRVTGCTLLSTGELLVTSFGGTFYLFDSNDGTAIGSGEQITGLENFVRSITSTPDDTVFVTQSGAVRKVAGGNASDISAYEGAAFGAASYEASSFQVRPTVIYLEEFDVVISSNWPDAGAADAVPTVFVQDATDGTLIQTIDDFDAGWRTAGLAVLMEADILHLFVAGFDSVLRVYTLDGTIDVDSWELYQY